MKIADLFKKISGILSICIFCVGLIVLAGWIFDIPTLKSIIPAFVTMKANTAICFILIGLSLWLSQEKRLGKRSANWIAKFCAFIVLLIGFLTFWQYLFKCNLGIDQILFKESSTAVLTNSPGRMALNTSINFILIGFVLLITGAKAVFWSYLSQILIILEGIISLLSFVGYLYGASPLYIGLYFSTAMALHTTVLFIIVCISYLFLAPEQAVMKNISSSNSGGIMMRRILPVIFIISLFLGWLKIFGEKRGLYSHEFGVSLVAILNMLVISLAVYVLSVYLNRLDAKSKKAEEAAVKARDYFNALINNITDPIFVKDNQHKFVLINNAFCQFFGYSRDSLIGKSDYDFFSKNQSDIFWKFDEMVFDSGQENINEEEVTNASGRIRIVVTKKTLYTDKEGNKFIVGIIRDISERKKAEGEFKAAYEDLKETQAQLIQCSKMSALGQLAGGVAHELNNPLTGVLNNVQLIKIEAEAKKDFNISEFKELLDIVEASAVRCKKITQSLLDFTHIASGRFSSLSLNEIVEKTIDLVLQEMKLQNITFRKELCPDLPQIQGDPQLLQQAVFGLIVNANWAIQKKSDGGGVITIKTECDPKGKGATLTISDTGIGIPQENFHKLFTPFFTTKEVGEGTGLGLALFFNIIENHHGRIDVESEVGVGTTFKIFLPSA